MDLDAAEHEDFIEVAADFLVRVGAGVMDAETGEQVEPGEYVVDDIRHYPEESPASDARRTRDIWYGMRAVDDGKIHWIRSFDCVPVDPA